jgi:threonine aldolase
MREAMMAAVVGDDVFGEDPSINALEEKAAYLMGKEAALFVPSGTMANQIAIKVLTNPGDEVIVEAGAHPFMYEAGTAAVFSSVQYRPLTGHRGILDPAAIQAALRPEDDVHQPRTRLICLENTHNRGGGTVYPLAAVEAIRQVALQRRVAMHLDGARLFNAAVASGLAPREYARHFETVCFCLSKGLGAPVGSILTGSREHIHLARRWRKALGGGMRQAGFLAAAGLYALDHHVDRLAEDHENAQILAKGLAGVPGIDLNPAEVETNLVIFRIVRPGMTPADLTGRLKERGVRMLPFGPDQIRAVTHLNVTQAGVTRAVETVARVMAG